jgi:hypothetical protein
LSIASLPREPPIQQSIFPLYFEKHPYFQLFSPTYLVPTVEVLDPMILRSSVREVCDCSCSDTICQIPAGIRGMFDEELVLSGDRRRLFVTLGQFSIVRLERSDQLIVPVLDYSLPTKECCDNPGGTEDPCEMFSRIPFPAKQFAPTDCPGDHAIPNRCK